jgi:thioredoxin-dependent peroxiredoxin
MSRHFSVRRRAAAPGLAEPCDQSPGCGILYQGPEGGRRLRTIRPGGVGMRRKLNLAALSIAAVLLLAALAMAAFLLLATPALAAHPETGAQAPQFTLPSQDGSPVSLADFRGKWVVLYFYPKDFTSGCTLEAHNFQRDLAQYEKHNAVILGISVDSADSHRQFCVKEGLSFKLLADTGHTVSEQYGTLSHMVFAHAQRNTFLISPDGKIARVFDDVKPSEHSAQVLAALDQLQK